VFVWFLQAPAQYGYRVVKTYPHDRMAFTQGLEYRDGFLYEGTGLAGRSSVRRIDLATGKVLQNYDLPQPYFGEGITLLNQQIFQITYQTQTGFVYDRSSFRVLRSFSYPGEGWGLTNDGKHIYMSDGTADIRVWDPATLKEVRRITVKDGLKPVLQINELEWVRGELYANIWHSDRIARISPGDGKVLGWIDLSGILPRNQRPEAEAVLNGIAYDPAGDRLFVTGKLWPSIFEIRLTPKK
jgi:glutaminyl-peptide cyclotransferase